MVGGMSPTHAAGSNSVALHGEEGGEGEGIITLYISEFIWGRLELKELLIYYNFRQIPILQHFL